ncbi:hypothetical protein IV203_032202 [Nitzschia inconspicua]|uniref:Uncharacterized protein n=1 Tax=Nitzschia inconspicua TaxID=303405 RepID=A0A9K3KJZ1_9STRA|nr:hypothetical protein IV203_033488 [Nitzschia inconspicua]KAG7337041.1 hypothetical protein IV203_022805 [Nitzschia inconspicua]KAG7344671.1 hypothetical protein IV203_032202 [Nitzschia inconspicua]
MYCRMDDAVSFSYHYPNIIPYYERTISENRIDQRLLVVNMTFVRQPKTPFLPLSGDIPTMYCRMDDAVSFSYYYPNIIPYYETTISENRIDQRLLVVNMTFVRQPKTPFLPLSGDIPTIYCRMDDSVSFSYHYPNIIPYYGTNLSDASQTGHPVDSSPVLWLYSHSGGLFQFDSHGVFDTGRFDLAYYEDSVITLKLDLTEEGTLSACVDSDRERILSTDMKSEFEKAFESDGTPAFTPCLFMASPTSAMCFGSKDMPND